MKIRMRKMEVNTIIITCLNENEYLCIKSALLVSNFVPFLFFPEVGDNQFICPTGNKHFS